jgi:queuine tRNA-ribosyltransferase
VKAGEILAAMLLTTHNLTYYADLMRTMREAILAGNLAQIEAP